MSRINLGRSRYGDDRYLDKVEDGIWATSGFKNVSYIRIGQREDDDKGFGFIDPDGGPFISVGSKINQEETIVNIKFEDGRYLIYTDKYKENE